MRITALTPQKRHSERVNLHVDDEFRCGLALEIARDAGLRVGDDIDEATITSLEHRDTAWKARQAAFSLLAHRARTRAELRRRLLRKDFPLAIVEECVERLAEKGMVDDAEFAESFVRDRVRLRPKGPRRLVQELRSKGVERSLAEAVVGEVFEDENVSELDLAREAADKWARRNLRSTTAAPPAGREPNDPWKMRRRLYGYLGRRGFRGDAIRIAMDEVFPAIRD